MGRVAKAENCYGSQAASKLMRRPSAPRYFWNIGSQGNENTFAIVFRQPGNGAKWNGKDAVGRKAMKGMNDPILETASDVVDAGDALVALAERFMKDDSAMYPLKTKHDHRRDNAKRETAARPSERGVLQQDPLSAPLLADSSELQ